MSKSLPSWAWLRHYGRAARRPFSNPWAVVGLVVGIVAAVIAAVQHGWAWLGLLSTLPAYLALWCPLEALLTSRRELKALVAADLDTRQREIRSEVTMKSAKALLRQVSADLQRLMEDAALCDEWGEKYAVAWNEFFMGIVGPPALTETARFSFEEQQAQFRHANSGKYGVHDAAKGQVKELRCAVESLASTLRPIDFDADVMLDEDRQPGVLLAMLTRRQIHAEEAQRQSDTHREGPAV